MDTLIEEIKTRIELYGGADKVIAAIEQEWRAPRQTYKIWRKEEIEILKTNTEFTVIELSIQLQRTYKSVKAKIKRLTKQ